MTSQNYFDSPTVETSPRLMLTTAVIKRTKDKITDFLTPVKSNKKPCNKKGCKWIPPPAPKIRPVAKDLSSIEVITLVETTNDLCIKMKPDEFEELKEEEEVVDLTPYLRYEFQSPMPALPSPIHSPVSVINDIEVFIDGMWMRSADLFEDEI